MDIRKSDVAEFQALYKAHTGEELDYQSAYKKLCLLVRQMEIVYQPITKKQLKTFTNKEDRTKTSYSKKNKP